MNTVVQLGADLSFLLLLHAIVTCHSVSPMNEPACGMLDADVCMLRVTWLEQSIVYMPAPLLKICLLN